MSQRNIDRYAASNRFDPHLGRLGDMDNPPASETLY